MPLRQPSGRSVQWNDRNCHFDNGEDDRWRLIASPVVQSVQQRCCLPFRTLRVGVPQRIPDVGVQRTGGADHLSASLPLLWCRLTNSSR